MQNKKDETLIGNEVIEQWMEALSKEPSDEALAMVMTSIRKRMMEKGQLVVDVEMNPAGGLMLKARTVKGKGNWFVAYTSFEEQMEGGESVMSTFMADIEQLFQLTLSDDTIEGVVLNPWHHPVMLSKQLISIIMGQ